MADLDLDAKLSPEEKLRVRMAAENYPHYSTLKDVDSDGSEGFMEEGREKKPPGRCSTITAGYSSQISYGQKNLVLDTKKGYTAVARSVSNPLIY